MMAIPVADALASIRTNGAYVSPQSELGRRLARFDEAGLPIKTPYGFEFLAQNSFDDPVGQTTLSCNHR